jgi:glutathione S-transferase
MKLYIRPTAPNPVKVLVFAAERGIPVETIDVTTLSAEAFRAINPLGTVPTLVTDVGSVLSESLTICQYLDDIAPGASLFGSDAEERATIGMWERRAELMLLNPVIQLVHHTLPMFAAHMRQFPDWAHEQVKISAGMVELLETQLGGNDYVAGSRFTVADITAFLGISALGAFGALPTPPGPGVSGWLERIGSRPGFAPVRALAAV